MVAEELRFPELAKAFFESGPGRASASLGAALKQRRAAWRIAVDDCDRAAEQFLGMIRDDLHLRVVLGLRKPPGPKEAERTVAQAVAIFVRGCRPARSEEHTSELQSLMRISYAVFCLKKKNTHTMKCTAIQPNQ